MATNFTSANNVQSLNYANTFGDWVNTTNALTIENNNLALNNYVKPTGTLLLRDPTQGLTVNAGALFAGTLSVQGTGSSANIQNQLGVWGTIYANNANVLSLALSANGRANIAGTLYATNTGTSLFVSNNAIISGNITILNNITGQANLNIYKNVSSNTLQANNSINTATLMVTGNTFTNALQANNSINTNVLYVSTIEGNNNNSGTANFKDVYANNISVSSVQAINFTVTGNFTQAGPTLYNSTIFTLASGTAISTPDNPYAYYTANRLPEANATIRWNNSSYGLTGNVGYWDILDVNSSVSSYSQIMTANMISTSTTSTSSNTVPTSKILASAYAVANVGNTFVTSGGSIGGTVSITGALNVTGNLNVVGTTVYANTSIFQANDSLIELASNNKTDLLDIGFYGVYQPTANPAVPTYSGLAKRSASNNFTLFQGLTTRPTSNTLGTVNVVNYGTLQANIAAGNVTSSQAIGIASGGTNSNNSSFTNNTLTFYNSSTGGITSLANTSVTPGTYGGALAIPQITLDAYGRVTGVQTVSGPTGPQGFQGVLGAQGVQGAVGVQGFQGFQGVLGAQGVQGAVGVQGFQGFQGVLGAQGVQGVQGAVGAQGFQGFQGVLGAQGVQGAVGAQGFQGVGYSGLTSSTSNNIAASGTISFTTNFSQGTGTAFAAGQRVRIFQTSTPANFMEGSISTFSGTTLAFVISNSGGSGTAITAWSIVATGIQGAAGAQGVQGAAGAQGFQGFQGVLGAQGVQGAVGAQGFQGVLGAQGVQGAVGAQGFQGVLGAQGVQGAVGAQGFQGFQGVLGAQGVQGAVGAQGFQGVLGAQGVQGATGTGSAGAQGVQGAAGAQGVQGATGTGSAGAQGVQGAAGAQGATGNPFGGGTFTAGIAVTGAITATGDITAYFTSDSRLKTNIVKIDNALNKVNSVDGVTFNWNDLAIGKDKNQREAGLLAQQIQAILPEVVAERDTGYLAVRYEKLIPLIIEAIKELKAEVDKLKIK